MIQPLRKNVCQNLKSLKPSPTLLFSNSILKLGALNSGKVSAANPGDIRDMGSIPELGRSPRGRHDNLLQYFCLENLMDRGACPGGRKRIRHEGSDFAHSTFFNSYVTYPPQNENTCLQKDLHTRFIAD